MRTFTVISILCLPRTYSLRVEGGEGGGTAVKNVGLAPEDRAGDTISENLELGPSWNPVLAKELPEYIAADDMQSTHQEQTAKSVPKRLTKKEEAMEMMKESGYKDVLNAFTDYKTQIEEKRQVSICPVILLNKLPRYIEDLCEFLKFVKTRSNVLSHLEFRDIPLLDKGLCDQMKPDVDVVRVSNFVVQLEESFWKLMQAILYYESLTKSDETKSEHTRAQAYLKKFQCSDRELNRAKSTLASQSGSSDMSIDLMLALLVPVRGDTLSLAKLKFGQASNWWICGPLDGQDAIIISPELPLDYEDEEDRCWQVPLDFDPGDFDPGDLGQKKKGVLGRAGSFLSKWFKRNWTRGHQFFSKYLSFPRTGQKMLNEPKKSSGAAAA